MLLPHIASATVQARTAMAMTTAQNIVNALQGKRMPAQLWIMMMKLVFINVKPRVTTGTDIVKLKFAKEINVT